MSKETDAGDGETSVAMASDDAGEPTDTAEDTDDQSGTETDSESGTEVDSKAEDADTEDPIAKRKRRLDERELGLDRRSERLDEREAALDEREAELDEREEKLVTKRSELGEWETQLEKRETSLDEREANIEETEGELTERAQRLNEHEQTLNTYLAGQVDDLETSIQETMWAALDSYESEDVGRFGPRGALLVGFVGLVLTVAGTAYAAAAALDASVVLFGATVSNAAVAAVLLVVGFAANLLSVTDRV